MNKVNALLLSTIMALGASSNMIVDSSYSKRKVGASQKNKKKHKAEKMARKKQRNRK